MKIKTGFNEIDKLLEGGFDCPSLVTIGSRPGMGKSAFLHSLAINFKAQDLSLSIYTIDSTVEQISRRTKGELDEFDAFDVTDFSSLVQVMNFDLKRGGTKIFMVDYLQLLLNYDSEESYQECSKIVNFLKRFSAQNECLVIVCSQLNRKVDDRPGYRPTLTDIQDSGSLEEASDLIAFLLRRDYYDKNDRPGVAEFIVAKNRLGNDGTVCLSFKNESLRFSNYMPIKYPDFEDGDESEKPARSENKITRMAMRG